jgi:hypothetical protein
VFSACLLLLLLLLVLVLQSLLYVDADSQGTTCHNVTDTNATSDRSAVL